jgi:hypothetical protein
MSLDGGGLPKEAFLKSEMKKMKSLFLATVAVIALSAGVARADNTELNLQLQLAPVTGVAVQTNFDASGYHADVRVDDVSNSAQAVGNQVDITGVSGYGDGSAQFGAFGHINATQTDGSFFSPASSQVSAGGGVFGSSDYSYDSDTHVANVQVVAAPVSAFAVQHNAAIGDVRIDDVTNSAVAVGNVATIKLK